jgi:hypothetical protein
VRELQEASGKTQEKKRKKVSEKMRKRMWQVMMLEKLFEMV